MSRFRVAIVWCALLLAACAGLLPKAIVISEADLQEQLAKRFPLERSLLDAFDLRLSDPRLRLDAPANRLATELTLQGSDRRSGRTAQGHLALDYGLRYEPADASIRLVQPRVQSLQFDAASGGWSRRGEMLQRMAAALAERLLDDFVLYRVPAERLRRLRAAGVEPGRLQVTADGLELTLEPLRP